VREETSLKTKGEYPGSHFSQGKQCMP